MGENIKPGRSSDRSNPLPGLELNFRLKMQLILGADLSVSEARFHFQHHNLMIPKFQECFYRMHTTEGGQLACARLNIPSRFY